VTPVQSNALAARRIRLNRGVYDAATDQEISKPMLRRFLVVSATALLAGCEVREPLNADVTACVLAESDSQRYEIDVGKIVAVRGPCIGTIIDGQVNDLIRPVRTNILFHDLHTGGVTRVVAIDNDILAVEHVSKP